MSLMVSVSNEEFSKLREKLPAITAEQIMTTYGVSESTWRKMRKGIPIRQETLDRIYLRYTALAR